MHKGQDLGADATTPESWPVAYVESSEAAGQKMLSWDVELNQGQSGGGRGRRQSTTNNNRRHKMRKHSDSGLFIQPYLLALESPGHCPLQGIPGARWEEEHTSSHELAVCRHSGIYFPDWRRLACGTSICVLSIISSVYCVSTAAPPASLPVRSYLHDPR